MIGNSHGNFNHELEIEHECMQKHTLQMGSIC